MTSIFDVSPIKLILEVSAELKKLEQIKAPEWIAYVKTGVQAQRPVTQQDFWHVRAASLLRNIYKEGPIGISKLRSKYSARKNMGSSPEHFKKGGGSIIRKLLIQLEQAELVKKDKKGRTLTNKGMSLLDKTAAKLLKNKQE